MELNQETHAYVIRHEHIFILILDIKLDIKLRSW